MASETARFRLGDFSCVVLSDESSAATERDITNIFAQDSERMLAAFRALTEPLAFGINILLVETPGKRILIDSGNGQDNPADPGHLLDNLRSENIAPESIDTVIITHYHLDHINGLLDSEGHPTFAQARLVVPKLEHDYWMNETFLAAMDQKRAQQLRKIFTAYASRLTLADSGADIEPGIRYLPALGHTPGHSAVSINSGGARLLHIADTIHMPFQLNAMDAPPKFDVQPDIAITTRRALIKRAEAENLLTLVYHFPFPGLGHIQRMGDTGDTLAWMPMVLS